ncbi:hypothetical protein AAMO2058_000388000 [Amorphochlora amoebiformis]
MATLNLRLLVLAVSLPMKASMRTSHSQRHIKVHGAPEKPDYFPGPGVFSSEFGYFIAHLTQVLVRIDPSYLPSKPATIPPDRDYDILGGLLLNQTNPGPAKMPTNGKIKTNS